MSWKGCSRVAHILIAADNPGAANGLAPVVAPLKARGHRLTLIPEGVARTVWKAEEALFGGFDASADLLVTGTGLATTEQRLWLEARAAGMPSLATVEAATSYDLRFALDGGLVWPDHVATLNHGAAEGVAALAPAGLPIQVVGQPYFEQSSKRLRAAWAPETPPLVLFASEPVEEDYGRTDRGFNQYEVVPAMAQALAELGGPAMVVCPHPREDRSKWGAMDLATEPTEALLPRAGGVLGMTSAVMVLSALSAIPTLAYQPNRRYSLNPLVDDLCPVVTEPDDLPQALAWFLGRLGTVVEPPEAAHELMDGATDRLVAMIEGLLSQ
jgi:hypothetical protein